MDVRAHIEPAASGLPRRYRKIQIIREWLQKLMDQPYDERGQRLSLRIEQKHRAAVKTAASDLHIQVKCEKFDRTWLKVTIVEPGDAGNHKGTVKNFRL